MLDCFLTKTNRCNKLNLSKKLFVMEIVKMYLIRGKKNPRGVTAKQLIKHKNAVYGDFDHSTNI